MLRKSSGRLCNLAGTRDDSTIIISFYEGFAAFAKRTCLKQQRVYLGVKLVRHTTNDETALGKAVTWLRFGASGANLSHCHARLRRKNNKFPKALCDMGHVGLAIVMLSLALASGCHVSFLSKRASEQNCPTDVRKSHCWCFGEDALFQYPCGPDAEFYGHTPTCWREWPTSATQWRELHFGPFLPLLAPCTVPVVPVIFRVDGLEPLPPGFSEWAQEEAKVLYVDEVVAMDTTELAAPQTPLQSHEPNPKPNELREPHSASQVAPAATEWTAPAVDGNIRNEGDSLPENPWRPVSSQGNASALQFTPSPTIRCLPKCRYCRSQ